MPVNKPSVDELEKELEELRKVADQYKLLAENSTDVIWVLKPSGRFTYVSPSVKKLRGFSPEEVINQSLHEVMTEESAQKVSILLDSLKKDSSSANGMDSFQTDVEQLCKDGSTVWTEVLITPIRSEGGELQEILGVSRNIQGKKIAHQKSQERNNTLETIFRSSPSGMGMVVNRSLTHVNDRFCDMLGYSRKELLGQSSRMVYESDEEYEKVGKIKYDKIKANGTGGINTKMVKKDGSVLDVYMSSSPIDINDWSKGIIFNIQDISDIMEAEKQLVESERKYREMFETSPEAMVLVDKLGFIRGVNSAFCEISDRKPEDFLDKHFAKINMLSFKKLPHYIKLFNEVIIKKKNKIAEFDWIANNGETRSGIIHMGPVFKKGKVSGVQGLLKDITRQIEFEKNLILSKEKAEENDRLKTAFLETMSHELRTPLNAVIGFSNLIEEEENLEAIAEMNKYVSENGKKLLTIIESIFDMSVLETNSLVVKTDNVIIRDLFSELEHTLSGMLEHDKKVNVNTYFQPDNRSNIKTISTDRQRLKQLLTNLLTNAVRFTDKGSIRYGYSIIYDRIEFFVGDTGIGIPANKKEMIFEKFRQIDYSPTRTRGGLGLGLAICKEISNLLGGELRVESSPGEGSTFYFSIPLKQSVSKPINTGGMDLAGKCFLIVEDVESNYLYLDKLLSDSGAEVIWAKTGEEALSAASLIDNIDLVLMDIRLPDMNGYDITREIKKLKPGIPIVAQTAYAMSSDQKEAIDAGCSAHISKPIRIDDIKSIIAELLPVNPSRSFVI